MLDRPFQISPEQFEKQVKEWLEAAGIDLCDFKATHRELISGMDGEYEIDVVVRFNAMQVPFLILIECKRHFDPVKREVVQILNDRVRSAGAQKGMVFSTSKFQSGAVEYAEKHGIALIQIVDGGALIMGRSRDPMPGEPVFPDRPEFFGMLHSIAEEGKRTYTSIGLGDFDVLRKAIGLSNAG